MEYALREARSNEIEWLYELNKESYFEVVVQQFGNWDETLQRQMFLAKWEKLRRAQIIEIGKDRVGVLILERRESFDWLQEIQIGSHFQGKGLGTTILRHLLADARSRGLPLRLQVLYENHKAKRLYERIGFREIERLENHYLMEIT